MSVHAFKIKSSTDQETNPDFVPEPSPPELVNVLPDRVTQHVKNNFNPVLEEQEKPMSKVASTSHPEHIQGTYRFSETDNKSNILDSIEQNVVADCKWAKIESHVCDHDEIIENRVGCGDWQTERTKGSVPEEL